MAHFFVSFYILNYVFCFRNQRKNEEDRLKTSNLEMRATPKAVMCICSMIEVRFSQKKGYSMQLGKPMHATSPELPIKLANAYALL